MSLYVCIPSICEATLLSSPPELRKTSNASWSDMSIRSICSSMSTFTSIDDMLPIVSVNQRKNDNITSCNLALQSLRCIKDLSPGWMFNVWSSHLCGRRNPSCEFLSQLLPNRRANLVVSDLIWWTELCPGFVTLQLCWLCDDISACFTNTDCGVRHAHHISVCERDIRKQSGELRTSRLCKSAAAQGGGQQRERHVSSPLQYWDTNTTAHLYTQSRCVCFKRNDTKHSYNTISVHISKLAWTWSF